MMGSFYRIWAYEEKMGMWVAQEDYGRLRLPKGWSQDFVRNEPFEEFYNRGVNKWPLALLRSRIGDVNVYRVED